MPADADALVLVVTKHREAQRFLPALVAATAEIPTVHVAIKTHPAETPDVYDELARGQRHVTVLPASAPLAPLLRASRAVVTVNSTVALDAAVLGIPALVIGLPNNLSPFVDAGLLAGVQSHEIARPLRQILYDEEFRQQLGAARGHFLSRFGMRVRWPRRRSRRLTPCSSCWRRRPRSRFPGQRCRWSQH